MVLEPKKLRWVFQTITNSVFEGVGHGFENLYEQMEIAYNIVDKQKISLDKAINLIYQERPEVKDIVKNAITDIFYGGQCNLSRQTTLPSSFLADLSFNRGEKF